MRPILAALALIASQAHADTPIVDEDREVAPGQRVLFVLDKLEADTPVKIMLPPRYGAAVLKENRILYTAREGIERPIGDRFMLRYGDGEYFWLQVEIDPALVYPPEQQASVLAAFNGGEQGGNAQVAKLQERMAQIHELSR